MAHTQPVPVVPRAPLTDALIERAIVASDNADHLSDSEASMILLVCGPACRELLAYRRAAAHVQDVLAAPQNVVYLPGGVAS